MDTANDENMKDFYDIHEIKHCWQTQANLKLWRNWDHVRCQDVQNCDKNRQENCITYSKTFAEKGVTQTVLGCCSADGSSVPPMIIFKDMRLVEGLYTNAPGGSIVRLSKNGWINSELFLDWMLHFNNSIPPTRPILPLIDSHTAHVGMEEIDFSHQNKFIS